MESLFSDIRYALRNLLRRPGFTAVAVITLALGIGANSAIFSAINALLLKPLPITNQDRVVAIWDKDPGRGLEHNEATSLCSNQRPWSRIRTQRSSLRELSRLARAESRV